MKFRFSAVLLSATLLTAGCASISTTPMPKIESARGERVGVWVEAGSTPTHTHIGTTVFNNFTKTYPYDWKLNAELTRTLQQSIQGAGLEMVDLRKEGLSLADVSGLVQPGHGAWQAAPGKEEAVRRLRQQWRLKAVMVLKEGPVQADLECYGGPCNARYVGATGLYTRSMFNLTRYTAVAAYDWNVFVLDPLADTAKAESMRAVLKKPTRWLPSTDPADFSNLTEAELAPVREAILGFVKNASTEAVKTLNAR